MNQRIVTILQSVIVVAAFSLIGLAISIGEKHGLLLNTVFFISGAAIALVALGITSLFGAGVRAVFGTFPKPPRATSIAFVAFCCAILGWLVAFFVSSDVGVPLVVGGVLVGGASVLWGLAQFMFGQKK
jgi:hypothetical protein